MAYHTLGGIEVEPSMILLNATDLCERWGISHSMLLELEKKGFAMPKALYLPHGKRRWRLDTIIEFENRYSADSEIFVRHRPHNLAKDLANVVPGKGATKPGNDKRHSSAG